MEQSSFFKAVSPSIALVAVSHGSIVSATEKGACVMARAYSLFPRLDELIVGCAYSRKGIMWGNDTVRVTRVGSLANRCILCYIEFASMYSDLWKLAGSRMLALKFALETPAARTDILSLLTGAMFDVAFIINSDMSIVDNTYKVCSFFSKKSVSGVSFGSFIAVEEQKRSFQRNMDSGAGTWTMLLQLRSLTKCTVTYEPRRNQYLVCLSSCTEEEILSSPSSSPKTVRFNMDATEEVSPESSSESSAPSSVIRDWVDLECKKTRFRRTLQRYLSRDFAHSMKKFLEVSDVDFKKREWIVPKYILSSPLVMVEETMACLPSGIVQKKFLNAMNRESYFMCSQYLGNSIEGNANILNIDQDNPLTGNADLLHCVFRFFVSRLPDMANKQCAHTLVLLLDQARSYVSQSLGRLGALLTGMEAALALLSMVEDDPEAFSFDLVTHTFSEVMELHAELLKSRRGMLPSIFWLRLLWACAARRVGREDDAVSQLASLFSDTQNYSSRHPQATSTCQIQSIICYNLAMSAMGRASNDECFKWVYRLESMVTSTYVTLPYACIRLIDWMGQLQSRNGA